MVTLGQALSHPDYLIPVKGYRRWIVGKDKSDTKPRTLSCNLCGEEFSGPAERNRHYISVHTTVGNVKTEYHRSVSDDETCPGLEYSSNSVASIMPDPHISTTKRNNKLDEEPHPGYKKNKLIHDIEKHPGPIKPTMNDNTDNVKCIWEQTCESE